MVIENKLFLIKCDLNIYPVFHVKAIDLISATSKAIRIVKYYGNEKTVKVISIEEIPLLDWEDREE